MHSATKYLDGQGRVLGGAVVGSKKLTEEVFKFLRTAGPTLSAFNAWVLAKGLETLKIRMAAQSANALELATWLEAHPKVARVFYPGLASHPQHALAMRQQKSGGAIVSFEVKGGKPEAW
ncbi:PLP-dependent transferase, partial [Sphingomonas koreensis]|uniref:PLP-dependent transferase n=1 Tax=Sphingomonas koreensis TaxID=93064 RepID=UPI0019D08957